MNQKNLFVLAAMLTLLGCSSATVSVEPNPQEIDTGIDPNAWVRIPAGEFFEGQHEHLTMIPYDYEIMVTNVTNAQYAEFLNQALASGELDLVNGEVLGYYPGDEFDAHLHEVEIPAGNWLHIPLDSELVPLELGEGAAVTPVAGYENHPVVMVTWFGARAYCQQVGGGGRLPTELEWEKAARGTDTRPFPWGDEIARNNANYYSSHDLFEKMFSGLGGTTPVGFYNGQTYETYDTLDSPSPFGLYDMAGNVWQWTGDVYPDTHLRYLRGGSRSEYAYNLRVWTRNSAGPEHNGSGIGFRCARNVTD